MTKPIIKSRLIISGSEPELKVRKTFLALMVMRENEKLKEYEESSSSFDDEIERCSPDIATVLLINLF